VGAFLVASYVWRPVQSGIFVNGPAPLAEGWPAFLAVQARIWTLQLQQIVWPSNLSAHYTPEALTHISAPIAFAVLALVVGAAFLSRSSRLAALGVAVYVLALMPASNFLPQFHPIADRYLYVPLAGLGMIVAAICAWLRSRFSSALAGGALLVAGLAVLSLEYTANLQRQKAWQTPATLWTDVLRQYPNLAQAHIGMANAYYRTGDYAAALVSAQEAVRTSSGYWAEPYAMQALCQWESGKKQEALASFAMARKLSRAYESEASMRAALFLSPEQLATMRQILAAQ
jgi:tetratricopeptide (TPR) repeat protein